MRALLLRTPAPSVVWRLTMKVVVLSARIVVIQSVGKNVYTDNKVCHQR
ncbi:hypothetical protein SBF1_2470005 [Candidatus Desulfosporosinus infrequens]|uniref:Uncharacterized protein n=1 Tax=Candidatus Desulfosporosinus infrequens TaxID=2043169 RepID=A0A2U3KNU4_9FIRM|nr:hypothetical protein SBF1_2470005 [Candidatus Desulfosporosinus infrequens]